MLARQRLVRFAVGVLAVSVLCASGCNEKPKPTTPPIKVTGSSIDLDQLDCPSDTVKAIINAIKVNIGGPTALNAFEIVCLARDSSGDVVLQVKTVYQQPQNTPALLMLGPDSAGSLAQLQASSASSGGFTSVTGVGDAAASVIENVSGRRAVTLYVQRGGTEFHISMEISLPDSVVQKDEETLAKALLPLLPSTPARSTASVNPLDQAAFFAGGYAASLLTPTEITAAMGRPTLPLSANGGKPSYQPGIDVSNATTVTKDGTVFFDLQVYRAGSATAARAFLLSFFEVPTTTPNPQLVGLGDDAFLDVPGMRLLVLSGREIASISIHGSTVSGNDALPMERTLAAAIAPRLLH